MMKLTGKNIAIVVATATAVVAGNLTTNYVIAKKNGYKYNKETKKFEKVCPFGIDLETEDKIAKSNLAWGVLGSVIGAIVNKTMIENK